MENLAIKEAIKEAMLDSGASSHFIENARGTKLTGTSPKQVTIANGSNILATHTSQLPLSQLQTIARQAYVLPSLSRDALLSMRVLANNWYTTIFHPHQTGVTVHDNDSFKLTLLKPALLQGWHEASRLWTVPIIPASSEATAKAKAAFNIRATNNKWSD